MYDVIIVGACTAGTYFSGLLAKRGLNVLVIDRDTEENLAKRVEENYKAYLTSTGDPLTYFGEE